MRRDDRGLHRVREAVGAPGEGFMTTAEIRALAAQAGVGPGVPVLDLCCGVAGPGRLLARELGCDYLGVDASAGAIAAARARSDGLPCRFEVAQVPPVPGGAFDVVLLFETMLAFEDKDALVRGVAAALRPGGRFAFTLEEGAPLTAAERAAMPGGDTIWLTPLEEMTAALERAGLFVASLQDHSRSHRATAQALERAYAAHGAGDLLAAHRMWIDWLGSGRVRKLAVVSRSGRPACQDM